MWQSIFKKTASFDDFSHRNPGRYVLSNLYGAKLPAWHGHAAPRCGIFLFQAVPFSEKVLAI